MTLTENAKIILNKRYLQSGESYDEMFRRVAHYVAQPEPELEELFFQMMNLTKLCLTWKYTD